MTSKNWYPKVGDKFTIGSNIRTRDRSWTGGIWKCICVNALHVVFDHPEYGFKLITKSEYDFSLMECPDKEPEKWEPKKYSPNWTINDCGRINSYKNNSSAGRGYGNEWPTKEAAVIAKAMNKRNQWILQAKIERGYGDGGFYIYYGPRGGRYAVSNDGCTANPEITFETRLQAKDIIKMVALNDN